MSKKKKGTLRITSRIIESLDLPEELSGQVVKITMLGKAHMLVENHGGIYEFFEHNIRLKGDSGIISISGSSLVLLEINPERLYISGCINSVELE